MASTVPPQQMTVAQKLAQVNEQTWLTMGKQSSTLSWQQLTLLYLGNLSEMMTDYDRSMTCYESALRHNPYSIIALSQIASLCRGREQFARVKKKNDRAINQSRPYLPFFYSIIGS
jgi:tetratricopeptide (TPR) repeat protein